MDATNNIATDLFYKIRSRFKGLKLGDSGGAITINPEDARFFDFDYMEGEKAIGHVSISLAENNSLKVYFSTGISESMDVVQKKNWYGFLKELRVFAKRRLMSFDTRDIAKDNLDRRDYEFLTQQNQPKPQPPKPQPPIEEIDQLYNDEKIKIITNTIGFVTSLGIYKPKIALVSAFETVNEDIPSTVEARNIVEKLWQDERFYIGGPMSIDIAVSHEAAETKGIKHVVAGDADILIFPNNLPPFNFSVIKPA